MIKLEDKVIQLGIARGYLPGAVASEEQTGNAFRTQYLRLLEEIGEAARELRLGNREAFEMELGDVYVTLLNCRYILLKDRSAKNAFDHLAPAETIRRDLENAAGLQFEGVYYLAAAQKRCLALAYNKIKKRGGVLIGNDFFKPGDPEYIQYFKDLEE